MHTLFFASFFQADQSGRDGQGKYEETENSHQSEVSIV